MYKFVKRLSAAGIPFMVSGAYNFRSPVISWQWPAIKSPYNPIAWTTSLCMCYLPVYAAICGICGSIVALFWLLVLRPYTMTKANCSSDAAPPSRRSHKLRQTWPSLPRTPGLRDLCSIPRGSQSLPKWPTGGGRVCSLAIRGETLRPKQGKAGRPFPPPYGHARRHDHSSLHRCAVIRVINQARRSASSMDGHFGWSKISYSWCLAGVIGQGHRSMMYHISFFEACNFLIPVLVVLLNIVHAPKRSHYQYRYFIFSIGSDTLWNYSFELRYAK